MKKAALITIIIGIGIIFGNYAYKVFHKLNDRNRIARNIATLPQFNFVTLQNEDFTKKDLEDTLGKIIVQVFSPDCSHCQKMADSLVKYRADFSDVEMIMVTPFADSAAVARFVAEHHLDKLSGAYFLLDPKAEFFKTFGYTGVPTFFLYNKNKLVKMIKGETKIGNLSM